MSSSSPSLSPTESVTAAVPANLRIACLLPSATAICIALQLEDNIVGVTHECLIADSQISKKQQVCILTESGLPATASQGEIHDTISSATTSCSSSGKDIPSFYPLLKEQFDKARPNVVFTQDLCAVCAPTPEDVQKLLMDKQRQPSSSNHVTIVSLQPNTLQQVAESFVTVATACGVPQRGEALRQRWWSDLERLGAAIRQAVDDHDDDKGSTSQRTKPRVMLLEWLDPPFDGGHWTRQMMEYAGAEMARSQPETSSQPPPSVKSKQLPWKDVYDSQPDVVVVGCCGFDLQRNVKDTLAHAESLAPLADTATVFACDGNAYLTQPGPQLLVGVAILAQCAYHNQPKVLQSIAETNIIAPSKGFEVVDIQSRLAMDKTRAKVDDDLASAVGIGDIEDNVGAKGFAERHKDACERGEDFYDDPETGYKVFTEVAHKKRGYCCGSGCRHCPYNHQNVAGKNKAQKIQQPAILYEHQDDIDGENLFSLSQNDKVKVMFNSGGKDSFLTIRALARSHREEGPFGLVLLTTFDATSRNIAHQNIPIDDVIRQARHLNITLLGVPLRRGSGERYSSRIEKGVAAVQQYLLAKSLTNVKITTLVFGDLHLQHIRSWREQTFQSSGYHLEYPLWNVEYSILLDDLERSKVPCFISGTTVGDRAKVGTLFDRSFYKSAVAAGMDGFGENGEFHSIAQVWEVDRSVALGYAAS
mmetsp:Transcript_27624/g.76032  ORF Transcript_27624/g.76032 Transcript_27624/m.76032 type:complete len:703 (-) Transcript_27624:957-3065(-)